MYRSRKLWALWTYLLMEATHKKIHVFTNQTGTQMVQLLPGQYITGRKALAQELRMSERNIRTCLKALVDDEKVTIKSTNRYSIITIVNWHIYQSDEEKAASKTPINRPASDQQVTTKQEHKNIRNTKKEPSGLPDKGQKVKDEIEKCVQFLYESKIFEGAPTFVNTMRKHKKNDKAILHALIRIRQRANREPFPDNKTAWGYGIQIIKVEDGNYNEQDYIDEQPDPVALGEILKNAINKQNS